MLFDFKYDLADFRPPTIKLNKFAVEAPVTLSSLRLVMISSPSKLNQMVFCL